MSLTVNDFQARDLTRAVVEMGNAQRGLLNGLVFKPNPTVHMSEVIDFGKLNVPVKLSTPSRPGEPAMAVDLLVGDLKTVKPLMFRDKKVMGEDFHRLLDPSLAAYMGQHGTNVLDQAAEKIEREQRHLRNRFEDTLEVYMATALATGTITLTYRDSTTATVSYEYTGNGTSDTGDGYVVQPKLTTTARWSESTAKPATDINRLVRQIQQRSAQGGPYMCLMGYTAAEYFIERIESKFDNRRLNFGNLDMTVQANYLGTFRGVDCYMVVKSYQDANGDWQEAFPANKIVVLPVNSGLFTVEYGAPFDTYDPAVPAQLLPTTYFSKLLPKGDPPVNELIVETRPLPVIKNANAVRVLQVHD